MFLALAAMGFSLFSLLYERHWDMCGWRVGFVNISWRGEEIFFLLMRSKMELGR